MIPTRKIPTANRIGSDLLFVVSGFTKSRLLRVRRLILLGLGLTQKFFRIRIFWIDCERLFILSDRFRELSESMKADCKVVMSQGAGRVLLHHNPIMFDCF